MKGTEWGAVVAVVLALFGWIQTVARFGARLGRAERDIRELSGRVDCAATKTDVETGLTKIGTDISKMDLRLDGMDRRRETARGEIGGFRERTSRELGEIRSLLNQLLKQ